MKTPKLYCFFVAFFLLFSAKAQQKSYEKLGEMIQTNAQSTQNPIYTIPNGTKNSNSFLSSATTYGTAVQKPLAYFCDSKPKSHYVNFSRSATFLERGKPFELLLKTKNIAKKKNYIYVFYDWDRNGEFSASEKYKIKGATKKITVHIPKDAELGKTRIRVILSELNCFYNRADTEQPKSFIYDFVIFIKDSAVQKDAASSKQRKK